jgi:hypothetical protein
MRPNISVEEAVRIGRAAITALLDREHAVVWDEIEAKLSERPHRELPKGINPHILTIARQQLLAEGLMDQVTAVTRGGRTVDVFGLSNRKRRTVAFERTAARKRLLHARYLGWALTTVGSVNLIGNAGERVAQRSLRDAQSAGYLIPHAEGTAVSRLFNDPVPGGPFDDVAYLTVLEDGRPIAATMPVEVKNIRDWIYPSAAELYQLLDKCARIQLRHPDERLVPVLVCRRAHFTGFLMAKQLGFILIAAMAQPILPRSEVAIDAVQEINRELGYDLVRTDEALPKLVHEFRSTVPAIAARTAAKWAITAPVLADLFAQLRAPGVPVFTRANLMEELRNTTKDALDPEGGW